MGNNKSTLNKLKRTLSSSTKDRETKLEEPEPEPQDLNDSNEEREMKYYLANNDDDDIDGQHAKHFFKRYIFQNNFSAPIEERLVQGCKVLDVGCGPGTWLLDLANKYRNSHFFGIDIKPSYPREIKPENIVFKEADMFNGLPFPDNEFDFTHQESMQFIIKTDQWNYIISELVRVTKPGGFIELCEFISPQNSGPVVTKMYKIHSDISLQRGVDMTLIPCLDSLIELNQSITKAHREERTFIVGPNGGRIGMAILDIMTTFNTSEMAIDDITYNRGISKEELIDAFVNELGKELKVTNPELTVCRFWAQKNT